MRYYTRFFYFLLYFLASFASLQAQELSLGDKLPDYTFTSVFRYPASTINLSDFRGRILIIDLWRTTCGHAVASFTHFDSLQQAYPAQLSAIAVTTESREEIAAYLHENAYAGATRLPVVTDDSVLAGKRFKFLYIPHVVVLDGRGTIIAITEPEKITAEVIRTLVQGQEPHLPVKKEVTDFDYGVPVLTEGRGRNGESLVFTSTITRRLPGVAPLQSIDTSEDRVFYKAYNVSIPELYAQAYHIPSLKRNRLVLQVRDSSRFDKADSYRDEDWLNKNTWCYNLILPGGEAHPERYALQELNRFFGVTATVEKRKMDCLLLIRKGQGERWKPANRNGNYYMDSAGVTLIHNISMSSVSDAWDAAASLPLLDKTGLYSEWVDMKLPGDINNLVRFRKVLQQYDLDLVPARRKIEVLVIKEKNQPLR